LQSFSSVDGCMKEFFLIVLTFSVNYRLLIGTIPSPNIVVFFTVNVFSLFDVLIK